MTTEPRKTAKCPVTASVVSIESLQDIQAVLRSKGVVENSDVSSDNYIVKTPLGDINAREFQDGQLTMTNGDQHRHRRRLLNALVRPEELVRFREEVVLPSVDRWLSRAVRPTQDGQFGCDLAGVVELIFLEFAANFIGFRDVESEERMMKLRACALPIFGGLSASHFADREAVTKAGIAAKKVFAEEFFKPSYEACKADLERVAAGQLAKEEVPLNLMHMIVTGADPQYLDQETAIREAILFFVATTGTSTQAVLGTIEDLSHWFEDHPEDKARVNDMDFLSNALQESLRMRAPYVSYLTRLAAEDVDVASCPIKAGDEIHAFIARAGKDNSVFGADAREFNPNRTVPENVNRYGLAFGTGPHQCLGLRAVLGNDGKSGGHIRLLQALFRAGVEPNRKQKPQALAMGPQETADNIPTYTSYPVIFTHWT